MKKNAAPSRLVEIDIAKGMACLLMIAAHFVSAKLLPFGTFAAPLFFACSGMNTVLLIEKTRDNRRFDLYHLAFPVLLFFGGITQVIIAHGGGWRIFPEFLQCIAMSLLAIFLLSKGLRRPLAIGVLFPLPFLAQQALSLTFYRPPLNLLFSAGFALVPWLGFFLFGVLLLALGRRQAIGLLAALFPAAVLSLALAGRPPAKFHMSLSYILLALLVVVVCFVLARGLAAMPGRRCAAPLAEFFALPGRNALMFVYLHYFAVRFLACRDFFPHPLAYLALGTLYLYGACWVLLRAYEEVRHKTALLPWTLLLLAVLAALRWGGLLHPRASLPLADMLIGVLFASVYVLLRRQAVSWCGRTGVKEAEERERDGA